MVTGKAHTADMGLVAVVSLCTLAAIELRQIFLPEAVSTGPLKSTVVPNFGFPGPGMAWVLLVFAANTQYGDGHFQHSRGGEVLPAVCGTPGHTTALSPIHRCRPAD